MLNILNLIDDARCFETVRAMRWPQGVTCPHCDSPQVTKQGHDESQPERQKYECTVCRKRFDDLTGTIFAGHHQPLSIWMLCLYFMGLNLSNEQIAQELDMNSDDAQKMTTSFVRASLSESRRSRSAAKWNATKSMSWQDIRETRGGQKKGRPGRRRRLKGERGRGTLEKEKPPIFGMMQRSGEVVITMLPNVQQNTIAPLIKRTIAKGTVVYTDEYDIYSRLTEWGYPHHTVCHSAGEFARDEDGDGFCEIHVNTIEGFWSLLRSWLRPHRGVSQEKLPLYLGLFEFVHNVRKRGKALLGALIELLVTPTPRNAG